MAIELSKGTLAHTEGTARAEAVGGEVKWLILAVMTHGATPFPQGLQEQVDAFKTSEPGPGPKSGSGLLEEQREEDER